MMSLPQEVTEAMSDRLTALLTQLFPTQTGTPDWQGLVEGLSEALGGAMCGFWCQSHLTDPVAVHPREAISRIGQYENLPDVRRGYLLENDFEVGKLVPSLVTWDGGRWEREVLAPSGLRNEGYLLPLGGNGRSITALLSIWCAEGAPLDGEGRALVEQLTPFLLHATQAACEQQRTSAATDAFRELVDRLAVGVILLDANARVVFANGAAASRLEGAKAPVFLAQTAPPERSERLHDGLDRLLDEGEDPGGRRSFLVSRLRLDGGEDRPFGGAVTTAILVNDPGSVPAVPEAEMRARYGLTPAEAKLAALLVSDRSLEQAAAELGVKVGTVRTRLKTVFAKTRTNRQASLVRLLLTEANPLRTDAA